MATQPLIQVQEQARQPRLTRRPSHSFQLKTRPWQLQPCVIAPVLPGETLTNALVQARVVTDPIKNPLVGWWTEFYLFYVKLTDLDDFDVLSEMLVKGTSAAALNTPANPKTYHPGNSIDWAKLCLDRIVACYFRDEEEADLTAEIDGLPVQAVGLTNYLQSVVPDGAVPDPDENFPGQEFPLPDGYGQFAQHYAHWEAMRALMKTEVTFEDWLKTFGVSPPKAENDPRRPELVRYVRDWTYPTNTIDPSTGLPSSACSWAIAERADKRRFLQKPGFLIGVSCTRPKVYFGNQKGAGASMLDQPYSWMPGFLRNAPFTSLRQYAATDGPIGGVTAEPYWVDMRDLFIHGDQFFNFEPDDKSSTVALPDAGLNRKYPTLADADALFASVERNTIKVDGRCDLSILGHQSDTSL